MKKSTLISLAVILLSTVGIYPALGEAPHAHKSAQDQPSDTGQTNIIANIRSEIVADDSLSTRAHNITIVSDGPTKVLLRGTIDNEGERAKIVATAKRHAKEVVDEMAVKVK